MIVIVIAIGHAVGGETSAATVVPGAVKALPRYTYKVVEKYGGLAQCRIRGTASGWKEKTRMRSMVSRSTHAAADARAIRCAYKTPALASGRSG